MKKKNNINFNYLLLIFFFISIPIFISFNSINDFSFNVISSSKNTKTYLFTLPISFFFIIPFILLGLFNFYKDNEIFLLLVLVLISFFSSFLVKEFSNMILSVKIVTPLILLFGFEIFFKKKILLIEKKDLVHVTKKINFNLILIFMVIFSLTMISPLYLVHESKWLINQITVFNYYQYYSLVFILLLGLLMINNQKYLFFLVYFLSLYSVEFTTNQTFFLCLILIGVYYITNLLISNQKKYLISLTKICIFFLVLMLVFYLICVYLFYYTSELNMKVIFQEGRIPELNLNIPKNITYRFDYIFYFFNNVTFLELLTPVRSFVGISGKFYHNEFLVITSSLGIWGAILFYFVLLKRILFINNFYPQISFVISLFCFLSPLFLTTNLHPYTFIISSFFISYYYVLAKFLSQKTCK